jgi:hypothetical protein
MGATEILTLQNFGLMPQAHVRASMRRMMEEVLPRVRERIGVPVPASA